MSRSRSWRRSAVVAPLIQLVGEGGGFVEAEAGFWIGRILIRVILDPMEEPIYDAQMKMGVGIEPGSEAKEEADGSERGSFVEPWGRPPSSEPGGP
jgi:hypothetical protein